MTHKDESSHPEWTLSYSHNKVLKDMRNAARRRLQSEQSVNDCDPSTCTNGKCIATGECVEKNRLSHN